MGFGIQKLFVGRGRGEEKPGSRRERKSGLGIRGKGIERKGG